MTRVIDELRKNCPQPAVIYCIDNHDVKASRRAVTLALRQRRCWLQNVLVHVLDAYPEPGQVGWRDCTDEFIAQQTGGDGKTHYGIIYANGQVLWT